jgi:hypothetical protein
VTVPRTSRPRSPDASRRPARIQIADGFHLAALEEAEYEPVMLFINHSCEPNVGFADSIVLVAVRDIGAGEELTTDYALFDDHDAAVECRRGTPSCRGTVSGQDWQPRRIWRYLSLRLSARGAKRGAGPRRAGKRSG